MQRTRIKFCGLTRTQDVAAAARAGADALGFVFYAPSPRAVSVAQAASLLEAVPAFVSTVALVVDADDALMQRIHSLPIDCIQFHGDESPQKCAEQAQNIRWFKALQAKPEVDVASQAAVYAQAGACAILLDGYDPAQPKLKGGTGKALTWDGLPSLPLPLVLAGGLDAHNVAHAILEAKPFAVDVSGGIELADAQGKQYKGIKDADKMRAFAQAVQSVELSQRGVL